MTDLERYIAALQTVYQEPNAAPTNLARARAILRVFTGEAAELVAQDSRLPRYHLGNWVEEIQREGLYGWLGRPEPTPEKIGSARTGIAQMVLAALGEDYFETLAERELGAKDFRIEDHRPSRTDTDYRLVDSDNRPVFRLNIKFHGTLFRQSKEYVD